MPQKKSKHPLKNSTRRPGSCDCSSNPDSSPSRQHVIVPSENLAVAAFGGAGPVVPISGRRPHRPAEERLCHGKRVQHHFSKIKSNNRKTLRFFPNLPVRAWQHEPGVPAAARRLHLPRGLAQQDPRLHRAWHHRPVLLRLHGRFRKKSKLNKQLNYENTAGHRVHPEGGQVQMRPHPRHEHAADGQVLSDISARSGVRVVFETILFSPG